MSWETFWQLMVLIPWACLWAGFAIRGAIGAYEERGKKDAGT